MATDFHDKVSSILDAAARRRTSEREAFVTKMAGSNPALLKSVRSMLPHYLKLQNFEPARPRGTQWLLPGTTMFKRIVGAATEDVEWQPPFSIAPYSVTGILGRGGMGVVYLGIQAIHRKRVAIKILPSRMLSRQHRRRFQQEKELLQRLHHQGIVSVIDSGIVNIKDSKPHLESHERPYFVMEYVDGQPLNKHANAHGLTSLDRVMVLRAICDAVEYAHRRGVIHCDLKPDNILVGESGLPKILDFGIARLQDSVNVGKSESKQFVGTYAYASPEQLRGATSTLRPTTDVYSLGLVAHELLTGRHPRRRSGKLVVDLRSIRLGQSDAAPTADDHDFQRALVVVLATALRKTRGQPYRSAGEMGNDLQQIHDIFSTRLGAAKQPWYGQLVSSLTTRLRPQPVQATDHTRLLSAIFRKRIGLSGNESDFDARDDQKRD
ncbi:MAG: hypothetical protein DHS20C16_15740 [Phycisphaerae bacterium]|nr:MAG: hypothetical protein DHS20C16_15740 [Phycisphaerae bacterium]